MSGLGILAIAIGGGMLLEGAMYALFPGPMKRAMAEMQTMPENVYERSGYPLPPSVCYWFGF